MPQFLVGNKIILWIFIRVAVVAVGNLLSTFLYFNVSNNTSIQSGSLFLLTYINITHTHIATDTRTKMNTNTSFSSHQVLNILVLRLGCMWCSIQVVTLLLQGHWSYIGSRNCSLEWQLVWVVRGRVQLPAILSRFNYASNCLHRYRTYLVACTHRHNVNVNASVIAGGSEMHIW